MHKINTSAITFIKMLYKSALPLALPLQAYISDFTVHTIFCET